jgi:hypothetical protein
MLLLCKDIGILALLIPTQYLSRIFLRRYYPE